MKAMLRSIRSVAVVMLGLVLAVATSRPAAQESDAELERLHRVGDLLSSWTLDQERSSPTSAREMASSPFGSRAQSRRKGVRPPSTSPRTP
jgi:hypothetical protein